MRTITRLGIATGIMQKKAFGFGQQDPFGQANYFPDYGSHFMPTMMPPQGMMPMQQGQQAPNPTASVESGEGQPSTAMNMLGGGFTLARAGSIAGLPLTFAIDGIKHLTGNGPSWDNIQKEIGDNYAVDSSKDSYLGAAGKLVNGVGWGLSNPVAASRHVLDQADRGLSGGRDAAMYNQMKGYARGGARMMGAGWNAVKNTATGAWDRIANQPMNGPAKPQPRQPLSKPMAPKPMASGPAANNPVAPKPTTPTQLGSQTGGFGFYNNKPQTPAMGKPLS